MESVASEEPRKKCSNCQRDIELSKHRMHEIGCARMNYKCNVCGEIVAKSEKEEHDKEAHTKVICQYCQLEFSKKDHQQHEGDCSFKPKPCKYCDQVVKYEEYEKHTSYCGSKTKRCPTCQHNVCLKDEDMHAYGGECQAFQAEDKRKRELDQDKKRREEEFKAKEELERKRKEEESMRKKKEER